MLRLLFFYPINNNKKYIVCWRSLHSTTLQGLSSHRWFLCIIRRFVFLHWICLLKSTFKWQNKVRSEFEILFYFILSTKWNAENFILFFNEFDNAVLILLSVGTLNWKKSTEKMSWLARRDVFIENRLFLHKWIYLKNNLSFTSQLISIEFKVGLLPVDVPEKNYISPYNNVSPIFSNYNFFPTSNYYNNKSKLPFLLNEPEPKTQM